jgi:hypothetical protein
MRPSRTIVASSTTSPEIRAAAAKAKDASHERVGQLQGDWFPPGTRARLGPYWDGQVNIRQSQSGGIAAGFEIGATGGSGRFVSRSAGLEGGCCGAPWDTVIANRMSNHANTAPGLHFCSTIIGNHSNPKCSSALRSRTGETDELSDNHLKTAFLETTAGRVRFGPVSFLTSHVSAHWQPIR